MKTEVPSNVEVCSRCKAWRDCWIAPNGAYLCDDCKEGFGLWCCDTCNELAPQLSFVWIGERHLCHTCLTTEASRVATIHARYLKNNPDVAEYLKLKERAL